MIDYECPSSTINASLCQKNYNFISLSLLSLPLSHTHSLTYKLQIQTDMSTLNHLFDLPEQICYVECGFCATILMVMNSLVTLTALLEFMWLCFLTALVEFMWFVMPLSIFHFYVFNSTVRCR